MSAKKQPLGKAPAKLNSPKYNRWLLVSLVFITTIVFYNSLDNKFQTSWDDNHYILDNVDIKSLHVDNIGHTISNIFSANVAGNYHPLTMLTFSFEYAMFKLNPKPYHATNLLLHILNTLLVSLFVWLLVRQQWTAFITAMLFAIHPMHVESVAWISERKDVLYAFFYLAALCMYLLYIESSKRKFLLYIGMFLLFGASILSKAMASSLPVLLFAIDYFKGRKLTRTTIIEKIPFFVIAAVFGYVAILAQKSSDTIVVANFNLFDRVLFASYGIMMYLEKLILPFNLSCLYSYPSKQEGGYPFIFYLAPWIAIGIFFLVYYSRRFGRDVTFGFLFFLITIALVLQILPVGSALIADRYTYLPYIGLFFLAGRFVETLIQAKEGKLHVWKNAALSVLVVFSLTCSYLSMERCKVWEDTVTLLNDAIRKNNQEPILYNTRGGSYYVLNQLENATADFSRAIALKDDFASAHYNRGLAYNVAGKYNEAIEDFTKAIQSGPQYDNAYSDRGNSYLKLKRFDAAIQDYTTAIQKRPAYAAPYLNRGAAYIDIKLYPDAEADFDTAIRLNPKQSEAYFNRGVVRYLTGKYQESMRDLLTARNMGYAVKDEFIRMVQTEIDKSIN